MSHPSVLESLVPVAGSVNLVLTLSQIKLTFFWWDFRLGRAANLHWESGRRGERKEEYTLQGRKLYLSNPSKNEGPTGSLWSPRVVERTERGFESIHFLTV